MISKKSVSRVIISLVLIFMFSMNCDKDKSPTAPDNDLVGTWELTKLTIETAAGTETITKDLLDAMGGYWILKLKNGNKFESAYNLEAGLENTTGSYNLTEVQLTLTFNSGGAMAFDYTFADDVLTLKWTDEEDGELEHLTAEMQRQ